MYCGRCVCAWESVINVSSLEQSAMHHTNPVAVVPFAVGTTQRRPQERLTAECLTLESLIEQLPAVLGRYGCTLRCSPSFSSGHWGGDGTRYSPAVDLCVIGLSGT